MDFFKYLPIKREECVRFVVIGLMMLCILFIYSMQRIMKDTVVISLLGAEMISTLKLYGVLPVAILSMLVYSKLSSVFDKTSIFHGVNIFLVSYFVLFSYVLYPNKEALHLNFGTLSDIQCIKYIIMMIENWHCSLYYIFSELWGSMMLALMFWQTANQVFKVDEAKRLYPLFGFVAQFGMLLSGFCTSIFTGPEYLADGFQKSLHSVTLSICAASAVLSIAFWVLSNMIVSSDVINAETRAKNKPKLSFVEGLKYVFSSRYILLIASLLLCYGISINLVEGAWKAQARVVYPTSIQYAAFMGKLQSYTGFATIVSMLTGAYILKLISWRFAAMLTPIIIFITGGLFFIFSIYQDSMTRMLPFITVTPIVMAVFAGLWQNILSKATKYAFFDATKEMAYIPLDEALKSKGKAAADVIGGRLGKSGGAWIQWAMLAFIPGSTLLTISPMIFAIFAVVMVLWFISVTVLSRRFEELTAGTSGVGSVGGAKSKAVRS